MRLFFLGIITLTTPSAFAHQCDAFLMRVERITEKGTKTYQMMGGLEKVRASGIARFDLVSSAVPTINNIITEAVGKRAEALKLLFDLLASGRPRGERRIDHRVIGVEYDGHEFITLSAEGDRLLAHMSTALATKTDTAAVDTRTSVEILSGSWNEYLAGGELRFRMTEVGHRRFLGNTKAAFDSGLAKTGQDLTASFRRIAPEAVAVVEITSLEAPDRNVYVAKGDVLICELAPVHMQGVVSVQLSAP